jgi:hypothetical protein
MIVPQPGGRAAGEGRQLRLLWAVAPAWAGFLVMLPAVGMQ